MARTKISEFSATPANNTDIDSINIAEGCAPSGINDAIRELMAQLKDFQTGAVGDSFNGPIGTSTAAAGAFTTLSASSTLAVTGVATLTAQPILSSLTASRAVFTDASKGLVSNAITGTGNVVMSTSPTLVTPVLGAATGTSFQGIIGNVTPAAGNFTTLGASSTATLNTLASSGATLTGGTINGMTVGATTASSGAFTTVTASTAIGTASGGTGLGGATPFTSGGVVYASSSSALATGSALTFDGTNLGVGIATGLAKLHLYGSGQIGIVESSGNYTTTGSGYLRWKDVNGNAAFVGFGGNANNFDIFNGLNGAITFNTNSAEVGRFTSTGLGIGTSSPTNKLTIGGTDSSVFFKNAGATTGYAATQIVNTGGSFYVGVTSSTGTFWQNTGGNYAATIGTSNATNLTFATNDNVRAILDTSGNLGLGVTPSAWFAGAKVFEFGSKGNTLTSGGAVQTLLTSNAFFDSSWKYGTTGAAAFYELNSGSHKWAIAPSGTAGNAITFTQAMTLDASGNLGVGTTSPVGKVDVQQSTTDMVGLSILNTNGAVGTTTSSQVRLGITNSAGVSYAVIKAQEASADDYPALTFGVQNAVTTTPTERARIDSSGNLLVGTTNIVRTGDRFAVVGTGAQVASFQQDTNTSGFNVISSNLGSNGNNTSSAHFWGNTSSVGNWYLYGNGTTSYSSDSRLKKNIVTTRNGYIDDLCRLRVVKYNWKNDADGTPQELGLIAQEVEEVFPNLVQDDMNPVETGGQIYKQLKQSVLPFMLLKAIQELKAEFDAYKASHP